MAGELEKVKRIGEGGKLSLACDSGGFIGVGWLYIKEKEDREAERIRQDSGWTR